MRKHQLYLTHGIGIIFNNLPLTYFKESSSITSNLLLNNTGIWGKDAFFRQFLVFMTSSTYGGTCGLAETCRTHNTEVVSSSPATANVLWTWANHFTLLDQSDIWYTAGGMIQSKCRWAVCTESCTPKWSKMIVMISWWQR